MYVDFPRSSIRRAVRNQTEGLRMNNSMFFLIIADHDKRQFMVVGPVLDDRPWNIRVVAEQRRGRDLTCSSEQAGPHHTLIGEHPNLPGYHYIEQPLL